MKLDKIAIGVLIIILAASKALALPQFFLTQNPNNQPQLFQQALFDLPEKASVRGLFFKNNQLQIIYEKNKLFYQAIPSNKQTLPLNLTITNEAGKIASIVIDEFDKTHLVGVKNKKEQHLYQLLYCQAPSREAMIITESLDKIEQPKIKLIKTELATVLVLSWQIEYLDRTEYYYTTSLDFGSHFSPTKKIETDQPLLALAYTGQKLQAAAINDGQINYTELPAAPLPPPELTSPNPGIRTNADNLTFDSDLVDSELLLYFITLENLDNHQTWQLKSPTLPLSPPAGLFSGSYQVSAVISDGFTTSNSSSPIKFYLDNDKPEISNLTYNTSQGKVNFTGQASEIPATVLVKDKVIELTTAATFDAQLDITGEKNSFTFKIKDAAGNSSILTQEVIYNSASPEVTIVQPKTEGWLRPGSTMIIEAKVFDLQKDIAADAQGIIFINNKALPNQLSFDPEEGSLYGFVTLPNNLTAGSQTIKITLADQKGNLGIASTTINLDNLAPQIEHDNNRIFTNSGHEIVVTAKDSLSGLDAASSSLAISGISPEVSVSQEGETLIFSTKLLLFEGSYEAEIATRDNVGNSCQLSKATLIVDLTNPVLTVTSTAPAQTQARQVEITGVVSDKYPGKINFYKNDRLAETLALNSNSFTYNLTLDPGLNNIKIEALDKAGNTDSYSFTVQADIKAVGLIEKCINGPNPFCPQKDLPGAFAAEGKGMVFSYALTQPAKVKIRIFDITGTLIWYKEIDSATSGVTAWSGVDKFGITAGSGIYPFVFSADSGGSQEMQRGKIVIVN